MTQIINVIVEQLNASNIVSFNSSTVVWKDTRNRVISQRIGRFMRASLPEEYKTIKEADLQSAIKKIVQNFMISEYTLCIGTTYADFLEFYSAESGSCMVEAAPAVAYYYSQVEGFRMGAIRNTSGKIVSRCDLWTYKDNIVIDLRYGIGENENSTLLKMLLKKYPNAAVRQGSCSDSYSFRSDEEKRIAIDMDFNMKKTPLIHPYMDTFGFYSHTSGRISIGNALKNVKIQDLSSEVCYHCGEEFFPVFKEDWTTDQSSVVCRGKCLAKIYDLSPETSRLLPVCPACQDAKRISETTPCAATPCRHCAMENWIENVSNQIARHFEGSILRYSETRVLVSQGRMSMQDGRLINAPVFKTYEECLEAVFGQQVVLSEEQKEYCINKIQCLAAYDDDLTVATYILADAITRRPKLGEMFLSHCSSGFEEHQMRSIALLVGEAAPMFSVNEWGEVIKEVASPRCKCSACGRNFHTSYEYYNTVGDSKTCCQCSELIFDGLNLVKSMARFLKNRRNKRSRRVNIV